MSDGFPLGSDDQHPPTLTSDTFNQCYSALHQMLQDEILHNLDSTDPGWMAAQTALLNVSGNLNYWYQYALDGDLGMLPGSAHATWTDLDAIRQHLVNDFGPLRTDAEILVEQWQGPAGGPASAYLASMSTKVQGYTGTGDGNESSGFIGEVGAVLRAAYTVQVAFKKDLYQIAKATRDAIKAIDGWGPSSTDIEALTLVLAGSGISATGSIIGASDGFVARAVSSFLGQVGGFVFSRATQTLNVGGGDVESIAESMRNAVDQAVSSYGNAASNVMSAMNQLETTLGDASRSLPRPTAAQSTNATGATSFSSLNRAL